MNLQLIIELDGSIHDLPEVQQKDKVRQAALEEAGYHVLRFTNDEVKHQLGAVKERLEKWIEAFEARASP